MRKVMILELLIIMGLLLMACEQDGELRIRNRSNAPIIASIDEGEQREIDAWSGWSRFYTEDATVKVDYEGLYVYPASVTRTVFLGLPTTINVYPDAGAMQIRNDSTFVITELYISPRDAQEWGANLISDSLSVGDNRSWTLDEGNWDVKVVSGDGVPYYKMNQAVTENETLVLRVSTFLPFAKFIKANSGRMDRENGYKSLNTPAFRRPVARITQQGS